MQDQPRIQSPGLQGLDEVRMTEEHDTGRGPEVGSFRLEDRMVHGKQVGGRVP